LLAVGNPYLILRHNPQLTTLDQVIKYVENMAPEDAPESEAGPMFLTGVVNPGDVLYLPMGAIVVEKAVNADCFAFRLPVQTVGAAFCVRAFTYLMNHVTATPALTAIAAKLVKLQDESDDDGDDADDPESGDASSSSSSDSGSEKPAKRAKRVAKASPGGSGTPTGAAEVVAEVAALGGSDTPTGAAEVVVEEAAPMGSNTPRADELLFGSGSEDDGVWGCYTSMAFMGQSFPVLG
jgi:hypothetical protein